LFVGRLDHLRGDHQKVFRRHHRLGVIALLEPATRYRHDTRRFVGQIDLIRRPCAFHRGLGWLASRLLRLARREFGLVLGLLPLIPFLGAGFDLGARRGKLRQPLLAARQFVRSISSPRVKPEMVPPNAISESSRRTPPLAKVMLPPLAPLVTTRVPSLMVGAASDIAATLNVRH
jgi:hypothetical protein